MASTPLQNIRTQVAAGTVSIGRHGRGTGFIVAPGKVVTNAHNLRDRTTSVTFADGQSVQAEVAGIDVDGDLSVLNADTAERAALSWSSSPPVEVGAEVYSVGRGGEQLRVTRGDVTVVDAEFRGPRGRVIRGGIEHTAPMARGASGGPVVDETGGVVAINTHRAGDGFYLARLADQGLRDRVARLIAGERVETPRLGVTLAPSHVAARLRAAVGLSARPGLLVRGVEPDSAAARAGLNEGDLIVGAGGRPVETIDDLHGALDQMTSSGRAVLEVTVLTGDAEHTATLSWVATTPES